MCRSYAEKLPPDSKLGVLEVMLVYQLMPAQFALEDIRKRRLKVSRLEDLNDPFELLGVRLERSDHRKQIRSWRDHMATISLMLCFSKKYMNPVLWSHYADKHRGICLAFEVPDHLLSEVTYAQERLEIDFELEAKNPSGVSHQTVQKLLTTKFADWQYENEVRMFVRPDKVIHDNDLRFYQFDGDLILRAVYLGPRCTVTPKEVRDEFQAEEQRVKVHSTRLAFKSYRVIRTPLIPSHA